MHKGFNSVYLTVGVFLLKVLAARNFSKKFNIVSKKISSLILRIIEVSYAMCNSMQDCSLGDDTVLDKINLAEPDQHELPDLSAEEQAVILGIW